MHGVAAARGMLWALGLATCSYSALNNGVTVMEFPLVVLVWLLLHILLLRVPSVEETRPPETTGIVALFFVGSTGFALPNRFRV